jgi:4-diphosphocytidyl-2-C-methyl-D-erythritol kinase
LASTASITGPVTGSLAEATQQSYKPAGRSRNRVAAGAVGVGWPISIAAVPHLPAGSLARPAEPVTVAVPAKINLALAVGPLRPDGYHELRTLFHAVDLCDLVLASPAPALELVLDGEESAGLSGDQHNLAWRAAALLAEQAGIGAAVRLRVTKRIPVAAGLAGGSADAAATLLACDRLWQLGLSAAVLDGLAGRLGSDVTFALHGRSAIGTGRGELLTDLPEAGRFHWVLAAAEGGLATPAVYAELDRQRSGGQADPAAPDFDGLIAALQAGRPDQLAALIGNGLQPAALALAPQLAETLAAGRELGALAGLVSGSGPTCAFLASDADQARRLAVDLQASGSCRSARAVLGGVPGATVLDQAAVTS